MPSIKRVVKTVCAATVLIVRAPEKNESLIAAFLMKLLYQVFVSSLMYKGRRGEPGCLARDVLNTC